MAKYQMIFDTQAGEKDFTVDIDHRELLAEIESDFLRDLEERGLFLRGNGEVFFKWEGRELNKWAPLPDQGVRPNDIIRVGVKAPPLQLRRNNAIYAVTEREELREGDDIII